MQEINGTLGIIILIIGILFLFVILVLGAKIQVQNNELLEKDKQYRKQYDRSVKDIKSLQFKLIEKENQIDKLEEVIHNLEKNKQYDNL